MKRKVCQIRANVHFLPAVKYSVRCTGFRITHKCSEVSRENRALKFHQKSIKKRGVGGIDLHFSKLGLSQSSFSFHENPTHCFVADTRSQMETWKGGGGFHAQILFTS